MNNIQRGKIGEYAALEYLLKRGYAYRDRNYRAQRCEIDLIVMDGATLVFVEVKSRMGTRLGLGREAVTKSKQQNIIKAAEAYVLEKELGDCFMRFDVIEVDLNDMKIEHIKDAFRADR